MELICFKVISQGRSVSTQSVYLEHMLRLFWPVDWRKWDRVRVQERVAGHKGHWQSNISTLVLTIVTEQQKLLVLWALWKVDFPP